MPKFTEMPLAVQIVWLVIGIIAISVVLLPVGFTIGTAVFAILL